MSAPKLTKDTPPTLLGQHGEAWEHDLAGAVARGLTNSEAPLDAQVASWIARAPYAHPFWHSYWISCVNLRDFQGVPPAVITLPGATHEVMVFALDPKHETTVDDFPHRLTPVNFVGQFIEPSDEAAAARIRQTVQDVIDGRLSPDTDFRYEWACRFSGSNLR